MSEDVRAKALRDAIFAVDQRLGNAEPEREWDHEERIYDRARFHAIEAIRALIASPAPPTTEGRGEGIYSPDVRQIAEAIAARPDLFPENHATMLMARAITSSPRVEDVRRMREALEEWFRWDLVIESAVRNDAPSDHAAIVRVIKKGRAALSLPDGEGKEKLATRASGPTAPTDLLQDKESSK